MTQQARQIPITAIILDEDIYPRKGVDHRRVGIFAENIRDGFKFEPIEVEHAPGPRQLTEEEARDTARRAYEKNSGRTSVEIGKAIGRARRTVDNYIADLRAVSQMGMDIKIFCMNRLGIPQDRMAKRLGQAREVIRDHLAKMAALPNPPNRDLSRGFTVAQVAQKHGWTDPMV